jgi:hypothetical protein
MGLRFFYESSHDYIKLAFQLKFFIMLKNIISIILGFVFISPNFSQSIEGRWDIEVKKGDKISPAWLEVSHSGFKQKVGRFVYIVGSSRPVSKINIDGNTFSFSIPPQWDKEENNLHLNGEITGDEIAGSIKEPNGSIYSFKGVRAPSLIKMIEPKWGKPTPLFNGKDLSGWKADGAKNEWVAENGILKNTKSGANLITDKTFGDFKLHIEFKVPKNGNSGIYLRGRHEVQVSDAKEASTIDLGGVYGFLKPLEIPKAVADVWHSYDITLVGRVVTIVLNGTTIVSKDEIPGITGGALDSKEGEPGPIYLQGDHTAVEYRNIRIQTAN